MNRLQRLIADRMAERGWNYSDVAQRGGMARATVHSIATRSSGRQAPRPDTLTKLAAGLELPLELVRDAAADAAGYSSDAEPALEADLERLVADLRRLEPADRGQVAGIVQTFLERRGPRE